MQTEVEGPGDEGRLQFAPPFDPVHVDGDRAGKTVTPILPDLVLVVLVRLDPRVGQATLPQDLLQGPGPGLVVGHEQVTGGGVVRTAFDVAAGPVDHPVRLLLPPHLQVLLPTVAAKGQGQ